MTKINIAIVEDEGLFRNGISAILKDVRDFEVAAAVESGKKFLDYLATARVHPDVILMDMNMPEMNGYELTTILQKQYPAIKIIILTVYNQERFISKMIDAGVSGYLVKNSEIEEVILAIRTIYKSGFYFNDGILKAIRNPHRAKSAQLLSHSKIPIEITDREEEILRCICQELTNTEMAEKFGISARTIEWHRTNLITKIGCKNTAGLVLFAIKYDIYNGGLFP